MIIRSTNMNVYLILGIFVVFLINLHTPNAYVLVQVQKKDDNLSNVDAIIHKTVLSDKVHLFTEKINQNKFMPKAKPSQRISMRANDDENNKKKSKRKSNHISITRNDETTKGSLRDFASVIEILLGNLASFTKSEMSKGAFLSKKGKPVSFRSGPKGSMMYELNSDHIIDSLNNVLSSKPMKRLVDTFSKQAAKFVRQLKDIRINDDNDKN